MIAADSTPDSGPASDLLLSSTRSPDLLDWGQFWMLFSARAAALFLLAGVVCFFAYNWASMPDFAKFGLIAALMAASAVLAFWRGPDSLSGGLGLLACGLLAGPLLAVYGQVYQTGANAWELFRTWSLFLVPLAVIGRKTGLCFALWVTATLWAGFYVVQNIPLYGYFDGFPLSMAFGQAIGFVLWEGAVFRFAAPGRDVLHARWFPRVWAFALLAYLTALLSAVIFGDMEGTGKPVAYGLLYLALTGGGAYYYDRVRHDLFMIALGLLSLLLLLLVVLINAAPGFSIPYTFFCLLAVIGAGTAAGKILLFSHRRASSLLSRAGATTAVSSDTANSAHEEKPAATPWPVRVLLSLSAWIAVPILLLLVALMFESMGAGGYLVLSLLGMGLATALSRGQGLFLTQAALCLGLAATLAAGVSTLELLGSELFIPLCFLLYFLGGYFFIRIPAYRFFAVLFCCLAFFAQMHRLVLSFSHGMENPALFALGEASIAAVGLYVLFGALYAACCLALARNWESRSRDGRLHVPAQPLLAGGFAALVFLGILPQIIVALSGGYRVMQELGYSLSLHRMAGIGAGIGLAGLIFMAGRGLSLSSLPSRIAMLAALLLACASWRYPWLGIGFFAATLARLAGSRPLVSLTVLYLAACTVLEYYLQTTTLLQKSLSLGLIGLGLAACALLVRFSMRAVVAGGGNPAADAGARSRLSFLWSGSLSEEQGEKHSSGAGSRLPHSAARKIAAVLCLCVFLAGFAWSVAGKERLLASGRKVILALRPVDPRSLMQGDYMILALAVEIDIATALKQSDAAGREALQGLAVAAPDAEGVYRFARLDHAEEPLAPHEVRLLFRRTSNGIRVGAGSFFFQEGHGKVYDKARFAELRAGESGETLITHLLDAQGKRIKPEKTQE